MKKRKLSTKVLAWILAAGMVVNAVPVNVFAEDGASEGLEVEQAEQGDSQLSENTGAQTGEGSVSQSSGNETGKEGDSGKSSPAENGNDISESGNDTSENDNDTSESGNNITGSGDEITEGSGNTLPSDGSGSISETTGNDKNTQNTGTEDNGQSEKNTVQSENIENGGEDNKEDGSVGKEGNKEEGDLEKEQSFLDAEFSISWSDESNLAGRRPEDIHDLIQIYGDGTQINDTEYEILLVETSEENGMDTYVYRIEDLPVYQKDLVTEIQYSLKQDTEAIKGYTKMSEQSFSDLDEVQVQQLLQGMETPEGTVELEKTAGSEDSSYHVNKAFGNYLPSYEVSGTISWLDENGSIRPSMEQYFRDQFAILLDGAPYKTFHMDYSDDSEDGSEWSYTIKGLFTTKSDGTPAVYTLAAGEAEGYVADNTEIEISGDVKDAWIEYAEEAALSEVMLYGAVQDGEDNTQNSENSENPVAKAEYNGNAVAAVIWQDVNDGINHVGTLPVQIRYAIDEGSGNSKWNTVSCSWDNETKAYVPDFSYEQKNELVSLGFTEEDLLSGKLSDTGSNNLNRKIQLSGMPSKITTSDAKIDGMITEKVTNILWDVIVTGAPEASNNSYFFKETDSTVGKRTYRLTPATEFILNLDVRNGSSGLSEKLGQKFFDAMKLYFNAAGTSYALDTAENGALQTYISENFGSNIKLGISKDWANSKITISGLPWCDENKAEFSYCIRVFDTTTGSGENQQEIADKIMVGDNGGDYYAVSYNNSNVPNFGDVYTSVYNKGTMILRLTGFTSYQATKIWLDEKVNSEERPQASWSLWRYSGEGRADGYQSASPVYTLTYTIDGNNKWHPVTTQVTQVLSGVSGERVSWNSLPKYNTDGYPYIYFVKESMASDSGYEKVFGNVGEDGTVAGDVLPYGGERGKDTSLYNGGVLSNRMSGETEASQTKIWRAAYYQDELQDITVVMKLQSRQKNNAASEWTDVSLSGSDGNLAAATQEINGFTLEELSKKVSLENLPRYDVWGKELEYRWIETALYEGSNRENNLLSTPSDDNGNKVFSLSENERNAVDGPEHYVSYVASEDSEDGLVKEGMIVNELQGTTDYYVQKHWETDIPDELNSIQVVLEQRSADGSLKQELTYTVRRPDADGTDGSNVSDGTSGADGSNVSDGTNGADGSGESDERDWTLMITGYPDQDGTPDPDRPLPKFDETGAKYTYMVTQEIIPDKYQGQWGVSYAYDLTDTSSSIDNLQYGVNNVKITNSAGGFGKIIKVKKEWLDDGDALNRKPVTIEVYRAADASAQTDDTLLDTVTLTAQKEWWQYVSVTEYKYTTTDREGNIQTIISKDPKEAWSEDIDPATDEKYSDLEKWKRDHFYSNGSYYIMETGMAGENPTSYNVDTVNLSQRGYPVIRTDKHTYEVLYKNSGDVTKGTGTDSDGFYTVVNRRIGVENLKVDKVWKDGNASSDERMRWEASFKIKCVEYPDAVGESVIETDKNDDDDQDNNQDNSQISNDGDETGQDQPNESYYVTLRNDNGEFVRQLIKNKEGSRQSYEVKLTGVTGTDNIETVYYCNLPKYDLSGRVIHYDVMETSPDDILKTEGEYCVEDTDITYVSSVQEDSETTDSGIINSSITDSDITIEKTVTNQRIKTKTVTFYKKWIDQSVFEDGKRPDIYLTIYQLDSDPRCDSDNDGIPDTLRLSDYVDRLWKKTGDDTEYDWACEVQMPKYDSTGREIIYYAVESTHVDTASLDYLPVQYQPSQEDKTADPKCKDSEITYENGIYGVEHFESLAVKPVGNDIWALKENGTFVKQLWDNITVVGKKVWENVPEGFPADELPKLKFILKRKKVSEEEASPVAVAETVERQSPGLSFDFTFRYEGTNDENGNYVVSVSETDDSGSGTTDTWNRLLPKYDAQTGELYTYSVAEEVTEDVGNVGSTKIAYEKLPGDIHNYVITNTYRRTGNNVGNITVSKNWENFPTKLSGYQYPEVQFTLYRFYKYKDGNGYSTPEAVATKSLNCNGASAVMFEDQLIYAPNFNPYIYFVQEKELNGYTIASGLGIGANTETCEAGLETSWPDQLPLSDRVAAAGCSPAFTIQRTLSDQASGDSGSNPVVSQATVDFTNTFTGNPITTVKGEKVWDDFGDVFETRQDLNLTLFRRAQKQAGTSVDNALSWQKVCEVTVTKNQSVIEPSEVRSVESSFNQHGTIKYSYDARGDIWSYTFYNLDGYAPNSSRWEYKVVEGTVDYDPENTEDPIKGTVANYDSVDGEGKPSDGVAYEATIISDNSIDGLDQCVTLGSLKNVNKTSLKVTKVWDQLENLSQPEVTFALQVSVDGGINWKWAKSYFGDRLVSVRPDSENSDSEILSYEYTKTIAANSSEETVVFENLPRYVKNENDIVKLSYRAMEVMVGSQAVYFTTDTQTGGADNGVAYDANNLESVPASGYLDPQPFSVRYQPENSVPSDEIGGAAIADSNGIAQWQHTVTNSPVGGTVSLSVTKNWENDDNNSFKTRPETSGNFWRVWFRLFRSCGNSVDSVDPASEIVLSGAEKSDTEYYPYDFYITSSMGSEDSGFSKTLDKLPKYNEYGQQYTYFVREINRNHGDIVSSPTSQNYTVTYGDTAVTELAEESNVVINSETVTNTLKLIDVVGKKQWTGDENITGLRPDITDGKCEEIDLTLYVSDDGGSTWKEAFGVDGMWPKAARIEPTWVDNNDGTWTWRFAGLPEKDANGRAYTYSVKEARVTGYNDAIYENTQSSGIGFSDEEENYSDNDENGVNNAAVTDRAIGAVVETGHEAAPISTITNTATEFILDKVGSDNPDVKLHHVTLTFVEADKTSVGSGWYFTWDRQPVNGSDDTLTVQETYTLYYNGAEKWSGTSVGESSVVIKGVPVSVYKLFAESAPYGYETAVGKYVTIEVKADGTIAVSPAGTIAAGSGDDIGKATLSDEPIMISLSKKNAANDSEITDNVKAGMVFEITGRFRESDSTLTSSTAKYIVGSNAALPSGKTEADVLKAGDLVSGQAYSIKELAAPSGFVLDGNTYHFIVNADGTIAISDEGQNVVLVSESTITFKNQAIKVILEKADALNGGNLLTGAEFELKDITDQADQPFKTVSVGTSGAGLGKLTLTGTDSNVPIIQNHTYVLKETKAADGYKLIDNLSVTFTVDTDGKVSFLPDSFDENYFRVSDDGKTIRVKNDPIQLNLVKADAENGSIKLENAVFALIKGTNINDAPAASGTTGADGTLQFITVKRSKPFILAAGNYVLKETTAPAGYKVMKPVKFIIDEYGSVTNLAYADGTSIETDGTANVTLSTDAAKNSTLTIQDEKTLFTLNKLGKDGESRSNLNDVTLKILDSGRNEILTWSRNADGTVVISVSDSYEYKSLIETNTSANTIKGLPAGNYILTEPAGTAPGNYLIIPDYSFSVNKDGTLTAMTPASNSSVVIDNTEGNISLTATDELVRGDVQITKYLGIKDGHKTLSGVEFELYEGTSPNGTRIRSSKTLVTGPDGKLTVTGLEIGDYYFKETSATADSKLKDEVIPFAITANVDRTKQPDTVMLDATNDVFAADVYFYKEDGTDGTRLDNATFTLVYTPVTTEAAGYVSAATKTYKTISSGDDKGKVALTGLTKGHYVLTETAAEGYYTGFQAEFDIVESDGGKTGTDAKKLHETVNFKVLSGTSGGEAIYDTSTNTVKNNRIPGSVAILKEDASSYEDLDGAVFTLKKVSEADGTAVGKSWDFMFTTGKTYCYDSVNDSFFQGSSSEFLGVTGVLKIMGLDWGTYTLTETKAPDGYVLPDTPVTKEFSITRTERDFTATVDKKGVLNVKNSIILQKRDASTSAGIVALVPGAVYTLAPRGADDKFADGTTSAKAYTIPDGSDGTTIGECVLAGVLVGGNEYVLIETKAPYGYELPAEADRSVTFKMNTNGTISAIGESSSGQTGIGENKNTVFISDKKISLSLEKQDTEGNPINGDVLDGTAFTVKGRFAQSGSVIGSEETVAVTAVNGSLGLDALDGKWLSSTGDTEGTDQFTYTLTETKAPAGYELPSETLKSITFTVDTEGHVHMTGNTVYSVAANDPEKIIVKDTPVEITVTKTNAAGISIGDEARGYAEFKVEGIFAGIRETRILGTTKIENGISDLSNKLKGKLITTNGHTEGTDQFTYRLTETKAPDGYVLTDLAPYVSFTVDTSGVLHFEDKDTNVFVGGDNPTVSGDGTTNISVKNDTMTVNLSKADINDKSGIDITGGQRGEAYFVVSPISSGTFADGNSDPITVHTGNNGTDALTGMLRPDTIYSVAETTAPKGYEIAPVVYIRVDKQGNLSIVDEQGQAAAADHGAVSGNCLTVKDKKIEVTLMKTDADAAGSTQIHLSGAVFKVKPATGNDSFVTAGMNEEGMTVTDENRGSVFDGELIAGNSYVISEITAPAGYELADSVMFTVNQDGTVTIPETIITNGQEQKNGPGTVIIDTSSGNSEVYIRIADEQIEIKLKKADYETGNLITASSAEFSLYQGTEIVSDKLIQSGITTVDGTVTLNQGYIGSPLLIDTEYTLVETKTPDGYGFAAPVVFQIDEHGNVKSSITNASAAGSEITVKDIKTSFRLEKLGVDGNSKTSLNGVTIAIYAKTDFGSGTSPVEGAVPVAKWSRNADGIESVAPVLGTTVDAVSGTEGNKQAVVRGLPMGEYILYEEVTPSGYDSIAPTNITIGGTGESSVTLEDIRIRGHIKLNKSVKDGVYTHVYDIANVQFDLYRVVGEVDGEESEESKETNKESNDIKIAENLSTDVNGIWASKDNGTDKFTDIDGTEKPFSAGLTTGRYYFVETETTADTVLDNQTKHLFTIGDSDTGSNGKENNVGVVNAPFGASVNLVKLDKDSGQPIHGVQFELFYIPEHKTKNDKVTKSMITDENGSLTFADLPKGQYTIEEKVAEGYDISGVHDESDKPFKAQFTIDEDDNGKNIVLNQNVSSESANPQVTLLEGSWTEDGITNQRLRGTVHLMKADGTTKEQLSDVTFTLYKKETSDDAIIWNKVQDFLTGKKYSVIDNLSGTELAEKGELTISDLDWGTYQLVETKAKDGYSVTDKNRLQEADTVLATAEFTFDRMTDKEITLKTDGADFYNYQTSLRIRKTGLDGMALSGAEFTLRGTFVNEEGETVEDGRMDLYADENGEIILQGVLIGGESYILTEVKSPDGYERMEKPLTFTVNPDGTVKFEEGYAKVDESNPSEGFALTQSDFFSNTITAYNRKVEVSIEKTDSTDTAKILGGAVFEVIPEKGSAFSDGSRKILLDTTEKLSNGLNGILMVGNTYVLQEVKAPEGYELQKDKLRFTVNDDGEVVSEKKDWASVASKDGHVSIRIADEPLEIGFLKRLKDDVVATGVPGAEFKLTGRFADRPENEILWTSTKEPTILKSALIAGETYTLYETKGPEGAAYVASAVELFTWTFKVDEDGNLTDLSSNLTYEKDTGVATVWNQPTKLAVYIRDANKKESGSDPLLPGYKYEITGRFTPDRYTEGSQDGLTVGPDGTAAGTIRITTNGKDAADNALKGRIIIGETYTIREVEAPSGYQLGTEITFTVTGAKVQPDGTIVLILEFKHGDLPAHYYIETDEYGNTIIVQRTNPLKVMVKKVDESGNPLSGVEFSLEGTFADGSEDEKTIKVDKNGQIVLDKILVESNPLEDDDYIYVLTETKTADGYELLESPFYFRAVSKAVDEAGNVVPDGSDSEAMRETRLEIVYGSGYTSEELRSMVQTSKSGDTVILTITNKKQQEEQKADAVKTGDDTNLMLLWMMMALSGMAMLLLERRRRKAR